MLVGIDNMRRWVILVWIRCCVPVCICWYCCVVECDVDFGVGCC